MSAQNKQGVVAAKSTGIVVGDGKHHRRRYNLHLKLVAVVLVACVVLGAVGWGVYRLVATFTRPASKVASTSKQNAPSKPDVSQLNTEEKYHYLADTGNYAGAEQALESQLAGAQDTTSKLAIYSQQSAVALQFKKYDDAKAYADKALQLDPNSDIPYATLAYWAQAQGDKKSAESYWQQAIDKLDPALPQYSLLKRQYQSSLQGLEQ